jgi:DNA-binding CsgD family transcriptional regulator
VSGNRVWDLEAKKYASRDIEIGKLYYEDWLTKLEIAKKLSLSYNTVLRTFTKYGWKTLPRPKRADPKEARRLYEKGLTQEAIARKLGVSYFTIGNYLRELGVKIRKNGYKSHEERVKGRRENAQRHRDKVKALRDDLFGCDCRICGVDRDKRTIAVHRKDCKDHDDKELWRLESLQKLNPEEWAAVCVMCHRGSHWTHEEMNIDFDKLESMAQQGKAAKSEDTLQNEESKDVQLKLEETKPSYSKEVREMRKDLFGEKCNFCGEIPDDKALVIHRKDGEEHDKEDLWDKERLQNLNLDDWVPLCQRHHRYVHWAMNRLHLDWDDIDNAIRRIGRR